jgi:hypothetical protein
MKHEKDKPSLTKLWGYLSILERANPLRYIHIDCPLPHGRALSPEELEEQKKKYRHFLLLQILRS